MKTIFVRDSNVTRLEDDICAAVGNFDGVHVGHQKLIEECKKHGLKSAVLTFNPHPSIFLKKIENYPLLTPLDMKMDIISKLGVDYLIVFEFNEVVARLSKEQFMDILEHMNIRSLVCGYDFTFGDKASGTIRDLEKRFNVYEVQKYVLDDVRVSSTYIKELMRYGNIHEANVLLGRCYGIRGKVTYGTQHGRMIGFPTANLCHNGYYLPKNGVYFVSVKYNNKEYLGMCNIGHNPTFNFAAEIRVEVHIFGLDEDIYDDIIEIRFIDHIRDEKKFSSVDELKAQLEIDKTKCLSYTGK